VGHVADQHPANILNKKLIKASKPFPTKNNYFFETFA
jgi:hypothetical protein